MITRPLDLAARLSPAPRSFDWLFYVNGGLIVLFFVFFGSKFVLAPALGVDFRVKEMPGANEEARTPTHHINVTDAGQVFTADGLLALEQLAGWLATQAKLAKEPVLLVIASKGVTIAMLTDIASAARAAGFAQVMTAAEEPRAGGVAGRTGDERPGR